MRKSLLFALCGLSFYLITGIAAADESSVTNTAVPVTSNNIDDKYVQNILSSQNEKAFDKLLAEGLDVNSRDASGNTMLFYTLTHNKDLYMSRKLIEAGADVNAPSANGMTPLLVATSKANELQLQKMMLASMEIDAAPEEVEKKIEEQINYEMNRAIAMTQMLIEQGADVNQETPMGTPLMNAATSDWNLDIIEILLEGGADINRQDKDGRTALFYAFTFKCDEVITLLIKSGADVSIKDKDGRTYLEVETADFK
ncbi:MAG: ankyrin repeat domain-containing protein [Alphaproteobacteria bacterium]|nr:ankyrin repeat domain-containing protein [Alphaproteobacteria bacterium]